MYIGKDVTMNISQVVFVYVIYLATKIVKRQIHIKAGKLVTKCYIGEKEMKTNKSVTADILIHNTINYILRLYKASKA